MVSVQDKVTREHLEPYVKAPFGDGDKFIEQLAWFRPRLAASRLDNAARVGVFAICHKGVGVVDHVTESLSSCVFLVLEDDPNDPRLVTPGFDVFLNANSAASEERVV